MVGPNEKFHQSLIYFDTSLFQFPSCAIRTILQSIHLIFNRRCGKLKFRLVLRRSGIPLPGLASLALAFYEGNESECLRFLPPSLPLSLSLSLSSLPCSDRSLESFIARPSGTNTFRAWKRLKRLPAADGSSILTA